MKKTLNKLLKFFIIFLVIIIFVFIIDYLRINTRYLLQKNNYKPAFKVYGNKNGYVPQGLAYSSKYNIVLQTSYSSDVSKLFIIDFDNGNLTKELELMNKDESKNNKHVGGIATNNEKVWISNNYEIDIYDLKEIVSTNNKSIKPTQEIPLSIRGDFCYFDNNILWVGDFYLKPFYDVPNGDPKLFGFNYKSNINFDKPDYTISLPKAVQGMVIFPNGEFAFTQSFTYLVNSNLSIYKNILETTDTKFSTKNKIDTIKIPPMAEGMFYKDGYLYILFESSTDKYSLAHPKLDYVLKYKIKK